MIHFKTDEEIEADFKASTARVDHWIVDSRF